MSIKIKKTLPIYLKDIFKAKRNNVVEMLDIDEHDEKYKTESLFTIEREIDLTEKDEKEFFDIVEKTFHAHLKYKVFHEPDSFFIFKLNGKNILRFTSYRTGVVIGTSNYAYIFNASFENKVEVRIRVKVLEYKPEPYKGNHDYGSISNQELEAWKTQVKFTKLRFEYKYREGKEKYTAWFDDHLKLIRILHEHNVYKKFLSRLDQHPVKLEGKYLASV